MMQFCAILLLLFILVSWLVCLWYFGTPDKDEGKYRILKDLDSRNYEYYRVQMWHRREWKDIRDTGRGLYLYYESKSHFYTLEKAIEMRDLHQKNRLEEEQRERDYKQAKKNYPIEIFINVQKEFEEHK